jgi:hypothetical protein
MTPRTFHEGKKFRSGQAEFFCLVYASAHQYHACDFGADNVLEAGSYGGEQVILMNAENT